jgi:DNA-binding Xre family transcriptional regulator
MPRSVSIHPERKQTVEDALKRNGFLTQGDLAANIGKALSTVSNFFNAKKVAISTFEEICEALGLDKQEIQRSLQSDQEAEMIAIPDFFAYDDAWVGRENLVKDLGDRLKASCRLLILLGISGIGKTALAEKLAIDLQGWFDGNSKLLRANFDFGDKASTKRLKSRYHFRVF